MRSTLVIEVLRPLPSLCFEGRTIALPRQRKVQALLALLAMAGPSSASREWVADLLWGDVEDGDRARGSLRKVLHDLRAAMSGAGLPPDVLNGGRLDLHLGIGTFSLDAAEVARLAETGLVHDALLARPGLDETILTSLEDVAPGFRDWLIGWRRVWQGRLTRSLRQIMREGQSRKESARAAEALLGLDPAHEEAARHLMRTRAEAGDPIGALRVYDALWQVLAEEHDTEPAAATQALVAGIKTGAIGTPGTMMPPHDAAAAGTEAPAVPAALVARLPFALPSIFVRPFENLGDDPEQDHLADAITEELITTLSRTRSFAVIARNSTFSRKGCNVGVRQIGRELGVRYVLEGGVRRSGDRVRITVQLVEAGEGVHVWGDRFEGTLGDTFEFQDRATSAIAAAIEPSLRSAEISRARSASPASPHAYDLYLRALPHLYLYTHDGYAEAVPLLEEALRRAPHFGHALAALAETTARATVAGWVADFDEGRWRALRLARAAVLADPENGVALALAAFSLALLGGGLDEAEDLATRALSLSPYSAVVQREAGWVFAYCGETGHALACFERARRFDPIDPRRNQTFAGMGVAHFFGRDFERAAHWSRRSIEARPDTTSPYRFLAASLVHLEQVPEAREVIASLLTRQPSSCVSRSLRSSHYRHAWMTSLYINALRVAGLPE